MQDIPDESLGASNPEMCPGIEFVIVKVQGTPGSAALVFGEANIITRGAEPMDVGHVIPLTDQYRGMVEITQHE